MTPRILLSLALLGSLWHASTMAQTIYRCGSSYSQTPCANGQPIQAGDARSASQKQQADEATRRDAALAQTLEKERLSQEKQALAAAHDPAPAPKAAASQTARAEPVRLKHRHARPGTAKSKDFVAEVPGTRRTLKPKKKPLSDADPS